MEIERINEHTVKFYISYMDIEDRGFDREDVWYNREKSEQLFWEMMDEVNEQEEFTIDGPLWIQVQAMDKGLEIIVTKAQLSKDGHKLELPTDDEKLLDLPIDDKVESLLDKGHFLQNGESNTDEDNDDPIEEEDGDFSIVLRFKDIEDVIQLGHSVQDTFAFEDQLYHYESSYYLFIQFTNDLLDDDAQEDVLSHMLEYSEESSITIYRLTEYGNPIFTEDALQNMKQHFPIQ
ncbi:adaptor protein MecA [Salinibacillus xinjiangensis]|uniref:Adapter protein MecA n=1 Tax=Salinibacillus xinjiangensis TaxID=1229268 RepID=A0A6G1X7Z2_9BACI|nr:adaptor protein MecA [Salinibacillus xinjiangensis]MRG87084.1 adaptor protein MecA [Salinibacillus xinjiangensis]